ncbi:MAG TPA: TraR/DksA C4-type zinc finger protein [Chthoniobacterales bacterium]
MASKKNHASKKSAKKTAARKHAPARKGTKAKKASASARKKRPAAKKAPLTRKPSRTAGKTSKQSSAPKLFSANNSNELLGAHVNARKGRRLDSFTRAQKDKLLQLRDAMVDSMAGVAQDTLRARAEGSEASAFGMHQADAGSDAYDRDFALSLLSQEQDALYEIDEALKRIDLGTYGICEMSGKAIPRRRLEAIPFARFTVECQSQLEKQSKASRIRQSVTSLFGLTDEEARDSEEEETTAEAKE